MVLTTARCTPEEYLKREESADTRHELIEGEIFEMAGAVSINRGLR